jgi:hypothetical protein
MEDNEPQSERLQLRVGPSFLRELDEWRAKQRPILTRAAAIKQIVAQALAGKGKR